MLPAAAAVALFFCALLSAFDGAASERVSAAQAAALAQSGDVVLIDIRTPAEWKETGVPASAFANSMHVPGFLERLNERMSGNKEAAIALICAHGNRSSWLSGELRKRGYKNIYDVSEGMLGSGAGPGWLARKLPVTKTTGTD